MAQYENTVALWKSYNIASAADLDKYLHNFRILFAYNSGKIENEAITYHDTCEIFENGKVASYTGDTRTLFEQQNQKLCYEFLKDKIVKRQPMTVGLIKEIHGILTGGTYDERRFIVNEERPGEFKKHDYVTGIHEVGTAAEDVDDEITSLVDEVNDYAGGDVLTAAAYFHLTFEYIHPFADGNGRVGRTMLNYYLMVNNHPPLIVYNEDKGLYYECLQKYDEDEEIKPLREFLQYQTEKTWKKQLALQEGIGQERKSLEDFTEDEQEQDEGQTMGM